MISPSCLNFEAPPSFVFEGLSSHLAAPPPRPILTCFLCVPCRIKGKWAVCSSPSLLFFVFFSNKLHGISPRANCAYRATAACRRSDCQLFADIGCHVQRDWSVRSYSWFSIQEPLLFYQVAPQLYSRGWVDPVPDPLPFFLDSARNRNRASGSVAENSDHWTTEAVPYRVYSYLRDSAIQFESTNCWISIQRYSVTVCYWCRNRTVNMYEYNKYTVSL
jgi:hypothetical protein